MSNAHALVWFALLGSLVPASTNGEMHAQASADPAGAGPAAAQRNLDRAAEAEEQRGTYIFYTQSYRDDQRRPVVFQGSVFGAIEQMQADDCDVKMQTEVTDLYAGWIGKKQIGKTSSVYRSAFDFTLTSDIADALRVVKLRPAQLDNGTNPVCTTTPGCTFPWIEVKAAHPVIKETQITNDVAGYDGYVKDFDGMVDHFLIPISSPEAGDDLIARLRALAHACGRP